MSSCLFLSGVLGRKKPSKDLSPRALGGSCFVCKLSHLFFRSISQMLSKNLEEYFCFWGVTFIFQEYLAGASKQKISENLGDESFCLQAVIFIFREYLAGTNEQKISENLGDESLCLQAVTFVFQEYLAGARKKKITKTLGDKCKLFWLRVLTNFVVLALLGGTGYLVYFLSMAQKTILSVSSSNGTQGAKGIFVDKFVSGCDVRLCGSCRGVLMESWLAFRHVYICDCHRSGLLCTVLYSGTLGGKWLSWEALFFLRP